MRLEGNVNKGWGYETIFATNDLYCGKLLTFTKKSAEFSMHFHSNKDETWYIQTGIFTVTTINTLNAEVDIKVLNPGDTWRNPPLLPHQLICIEPGSIIEVSTPDSVEDNYRVGKGDSQK